MRSEALIPDKNPSPPAQPPACPSLWGNDNDPPPVAHLLQNGLGIAVGTAHRNLKPATVWSYRKCKLHQAQHLTALYLELSPWLASSITQGNTRVCPCPASSESSWEDFGVCMEQGGCVHRSLLRGAGSLQAWTCGHQPTSYVLI